MPTLEGGAWSLGRRLLLIWGVTSRPSAAGRGARGCRSIASFIASSGQFMPTRRNSMRGGIAGLLPRQPMPRMRIQPWRSLGMGLGRVAGLLYAGSLSLPCWSSLYDRELRDVLALQSEVAQSIARKVEITLTGEEHAMLTAARSVSPDVYESYLKGRFNKNNTKAELEQSIVYFEGAIKKDPTFAAAYVGLADAYDSLGTVFVGAPPAEARQKQMSASRKALELDPTIAEAHALLADALQ